MAVLAPGLAAAQPSEMWKRAQSGAMDAETVLYRVANAHGMLRGVREVDAVLSNQFDARGSYEAGGQMYKLTRYRAQMNYHYPGMRVDLERTGPGGTERLIQVVSGQHAWNETEMPGGPATAAMDTLNDRLLELWMLPHSVVKAGRLATDKVTVGSEGGATVLTIPLPAPLSGTLTATLTPENRVGRVVAQVEGPQNGREVTYTNYKDPDLSDIPFPHRIVHRLGGRTVLDLTLTSAVMYNPYVVTPVPANVRGGTQ
jgi:hypothetical protein